jgi:putative transposase
VLNRALQGELDHHLGYGKGETPPEDQVNRRNGKSSNRLRTDQGEGQVDVPPGPGRKL